MATARMETWVHGVSVMPERTAGDVGDSSEPLVQVSNIPYSDIVGLRQGFGASFRGKALHSNWFHFSIPTPVVFPVFHPNTGMYDHETGHPVLLRRVFVFHRTDTFNDALGQPASKAFITDVHVWDGSQTRFIVKLDPNLSDDANTSVQLLDNGQHDVTVEEDINTWLIRTDGISSPITPAVTRGICISVHVQFGQESNIFFAAAGADFLLDVA